MLTDFYNTYAGYFDLAVGIDRKDGTFYCERDGYGRFAHGIELTFVRENGERVKKAEYLKSELFWEYAPYEPRSRITERLTHGPDGMPGTVDIVYMVKKDRITAEVVGLPCDVVPVFSGNISYGSGDDCMAVCLDRDVNEDDFRSAYGPAVSTKDDAFFDRKTDSAVTVRGKKGRKLGYSWGKACYTLETRGDFELYFEDRVFETRFRTKYRPINKNNTFPTPPCGWMTWYAVMFDACEKAVLDNARWQRDNLRDYGANAVWVDWEWYHEKFNNENAPGNIGFFSPDPVRYPHGLKYVSDKIKEMGFVPALWVGPTSEPAMTDTVKEFIDSVCAERVDWCGKYFFDITDERVRDELIPRAFEKVKEWGYEALKWDCLPITIVFADRFHEALKHPEMTSVEALRALCRKARETVGEDFYMLSCAGANDREVLMAADIFDGARIGGDIFKWSEFIADFVERIERFYPFHNTVLYCDPDNVVIRPEFNSTEQARSRVSAVSLLGLPVTLGDNLPDLPEERVELLRRILPALNIHPKDIREGRHNGQRFLINLAVNTPFDQWNVVDLLNLLETEKTFEIDICSDLGLESGEYVAFDFWEKKPVEIKDGKIRVTLNGMSSLVASVHKKEGRPQVVSTSRHVTQGASELKDVKWDPALNRLSGVSDVVKGDDYSVFVYVPDGWKAVNAEVTDNIAVIKPDTSENAAVGWIAEFER